MINEKELLFENIKQYSIILDDYINKRFKYILNTEYLKEEIKDVSGCLMKTIEEYEKILIEEEQNNSQGRL